MLYGDYFGTLLRLTLRIHIARRAPRILTARELYVFVSSSSSSDSSDKMSLQDPGRLLGIHPTAIPDKKPLAV